MTLNGRDILIILLKKSLLSPRKYGIIEYAVVSI